MLLSSDFARFDLLQGVMGGLVLGASSTFLYRCIGHTTGISGIISDNIVTQGEHSGGYWTVPYILGLLSSGVLLSFVLPSAFGAAAAFALRPELLIAAGVLVGFGTRLSNGCTSGHGVCGLGRRSLRSLVAVGTFMTTGAFAAAFSRSQILGSVSFAPAYSSAVQAFFTSASWPYFVPAILGSVSVALLFKEELIWDLLGHPKEFWSLLRPFSTEHRNSVMAAVASYAAALVFGLGLGISGMCQTERVKRFLDFGGVSGWDPTLMGVMGGAVLFNLATFSYMHNHNVPVAYPVLERKDSLQKVLKIGMVPENLNVDSRLVVGSGIFGLGWGLAGICPGPAIVSLGAHIPAAGLFAPAFVLGVGLLGKVFDFSRL